MFKDDINLEITKLSNNINLWHGILFKKLKHNNYSNILNRLILDLSNLFLKKYIFYPNKIYSKHLLNHYPKKKYELIVSNSPRNVVLAKESFKDKKIYFTKKEKKISAKLQKTKKKIIGYFPTWRYDGMEIFPETLKKDSLIRLNDFLVKNNFLLIIKKHPNSFKEDNHRFYNEESEKIFKILDNLKGFFLLDYDVDLNSIYIIGITSL